MQAAKQDIIRQLQKEVLALQRPQKTPVRSLSTGLWELEKAFPDNTFPLGAIHEFSSHTREDAAATNGFMGGLINPLIQKGKMAVWISTQRSLFPPALNRFGIAPHQIIFIDLQRHKDALWTIEEALKCEALSVVIGEINELSFTESRRLQLAVEQSRVTGFIHRCNPRRENTLACMTRWKIQTLASETDGMPGPGFPRWHVRLLKVRNGKPGSWHIEWSADRFRQLKHEPFQASDVQTRKTG